MQTSSRALSKKHHSYKEDNSHTNLVAFKKINQGRVLIILKRLMDVSISAFLLLILVPIVFPIVAILVALDSKGCVFFIQDRTGIRKTTFRCYKIRTMRLVNSLSDKTPEMGITRLGMFLRKTHIDELPQLVNVLLGQMSLVGPRPHMLSDTEEFESRIANYHLRHAVRPGITGLAQVNGFYGSVDDTDHLEKRIQFDIEYVYTWSIWSDIKIILRTIKEPLA